MRIIIKQEFDKKVDSFVIEQIGRNLSRKVGCALCRMGICQISGAKVATFVFSNTEPAL